MATLDEILRSNPDSLRLWFMHPGFDALIEIIQSRINDNWTRIQHIQLRSDEDIREELSLKGENEGLRRLMDWLVKKKSEVVLKSD